MAIDADVKAAADEATKLLVTALDRMEKSAAARAKGTDPGPDRLLFPHGIELIYLQFKFGEANITFSVAGKDAPKLPSLELATPPDPDQGQLPAA